MVRSIVGALVRVGHNRLSVDEVQLLLQSQDRTYAGRFYTSAPAHGLFLTDVSYDPNHRTARDWSMLGKQKAADKLAADLLKMNIDDVDMTKLPVV